MVKGTRSVGNSNEFNTTETVTLFPKAVHRYILLIFYLILRLLLL